MDQSLVNISTMFLPATWQYIATAGTGCGPSYGNLYLSPCVTKLAVSIIDLYTM